MIQLSNVVKEYNSKSGKVVALDNINLTLPDSGFVFLLGKSGCGKSTLLNVLSGLDKVTSGEIDVNGENISKLSAKQMDNYRNRTVGFVFQEYNLIEEYSVFENVAISLNLRGEKNLGNKVSEALSLVGLEGYEKRKISELSGGQKQRIAIARALVTDVQILFADEPTGNLDSDSSKGIFDLLKKLSKKILVFTVTHDAENAEKYGDRVISMKDGTIVSDKTLNEIPQTNKDIIYNKNKQAKKRNINLQSLTKLSFINIWKNKWRWLVTTVLFFFTLTMFGIALSAFQYDDINTMIEACYENNLDEFKFAKMDVEEESQKSFTASEIKDLQNRFLNHKFDMLYEIQYMKGLDILGLNAHGYGENHIAYIDNDILQRYGYDLCWGKLPTKAGEICLSRYVANEIIENNLISGVTDYASLSKAKIKIKMYPDIYFKMVGIVDTKLETRLDSLNMKENLREAIITEELEGSYTASIMVNEEFLTSCYLSDDSSSKTTYQYYVYMNGIYSNLTSDEQPLYSEKYANLATEQSAAFGEIFYKQGVSSLTSNQVIVPYKVMVEMTKAGLNKSNVTIDEISSYLNKSTMTLSNVRISYNNKSTFKHLQIAGFYTDEMREELIVSEKLLSSIKGSHGLNYMITKLTGNKSDDYDFAKYMFIDEEREDLRLYGLVWNDIWQSTISSSYNKNLGLYGAIAAGVFSIVMMANFIVTSINNNKKQIGILRALGMRTSGVLYIFMLEALLVGLLSFGLSVISLYIAVAIIGSFKGYAVTIHQLFITPIEIFAMFGLSVAICVIASIIPILIKSKIQPVDLIRN